MTKPMAEELISIWMEQLIVVTGKKINSMATESRRGQMQLSMKATTNTARSMESALLSGLMVLHTSENFTIIIFMARASIPGQIIENTRENGGLIKCMEKALSFGQILESISESTLKTRKRVTENSSGQMEGLTEESGSTENNTAKERISQAQAKKNTENGGTVKELDG